MKSKKFSLKNVNDSVADKISESYPAEWNMDKVFNASYKKFLASEKELNEEIHSAITETDGELEFCRVETVPQKRRIAVLTFRKLATAIMAVMVVVMLRMLYVMPDRIHDSSEDINKLPIITHERNEMSEINTSPATSTVYGGSDPVSTSTAASGSVPTETVTTKIVSAPTQDISPTEKTTSANEPGTEDHKIPTEPPHPLTNAGENKKPLTKAEFIELLKSKDDFTWSDFEQYKSENIGSGSYILKYEIVNENGEYFFALYLSGDSMTKKPQNIYLEHPNGEKMDIYKFKDLLLGLEPIEEPGYFQYTAYESGKWDTLQYIRNNNDNVVQKAHTLELDGFDFKVNREDEYTKEITVKEIESDQTYSLTMNSYERFLVSLNPKYERIKTELKINGKPGYFIRYADDKMQVCMLYWDDGCHICSLTSTIDSYDSMLFIAENLK